MREKLDEFRIRDLVNQGYNDRQIAEIMGCNRVSVTRVRGTIGLSRVTKYDKRDKVYVCVSCNKEITIKRSEPAQIMCSDCRENIQNIFNKESTF